MENPQVLYITQMPKDDLYKFIDGIRDHVFETPRVKNNLNVRFYPVSGEINDQPSKTIPDQSMTIQEILRRYASGLPMTGEKVPLYDEKVDINTDPGEYEFINPERLDIAELEQLEGYLIQTITERRKKYDDEKRAKADAEAAAREQESNSKTVGGETTAVPPTRSEVPGTTGK